MLLGGQCYLKAHIPLNINKMHRRQEPPCRCSQLARPGSNPGAASGLSYVCRPPSRVGSKFVIAFAVKFV